MRDIIKRRGLLII